MAEFNDTDDPYNIPNFSLLNVQIWVFVSAIINGLANGLLMYCLIKIGLKYSTYIAIFTIAILDTIQLISSPPIYELFSKTLNFLKEFETHSVFQNTFFGALYGIVLCYVLMMLKAHLQMIEKAFVYVIFGLWILLVIVFIGGYFGYQFYYHRHLFFEIYVVLFIVLFIMELVDQIINTINIGKEKSADYKICMMLTLLFITVRMFCPVVVFVITVTTQTLFQTRVIVHILFGLLQFNAIANIVVLAWIDLKFKNIFYGILRLKSPIRTNNVNFVNLPEETVNIIDEE